LSHVDPDPAVNATLLDIEIAPANPQPPSSVSADARAILKSKFGYDSFRPGQEEVLAALLDGTSVLAVMPTGSGKSLCYQIPALLRGGLTVVVSPLVALMEDQVTALRLAGVAAETINSSRSYNDNAASWRRAAAGDSPLLYISPERLMTDRMISALTQLPVKLIAIDEAHCISRWGPSFRPEYEQLGHLKEHFPGVPIAALTATADETTRIEIAAKLFDGNGKIVVRGFDRPNIRLAVEMRRSWKAQLLDFVKAREGQCGIVYCLSRKKTEEAATFLNENGIRALPYHAGMDKSLRIANQDTFMTDPGTVMVATIAFGMGIDKPDVRYVFHTNLPGNMESYYQEIGRAGRDGLPSDAHMLYGLDDIRMRRLFIDQEDGGEEHMRREHKRLDSLIAYCETPECRRQALLSYFDETSPPCGNCDICQDPPVLTDGTAVGRQILSVAQATGQRFGAAHLVDVLRGADTEKTRKFGHTGLPEFGIGSATSKEDLRSIIRQLVAAGLLQLDIKGYGGLSLTDKGAAFMAGTETFQYREDAFKNRAMKSPGGKAAPAAADLSVPEAKLFNALKERRRDLAKTRGVPAYVIFADRALADMARRKPRTEEEFAGVHGVGEAKLRDFATPFLEVISGYEQDAV
jgi:ATP-dependent DNA helicase RecQ